MDRRDGQGPCGPISCQICWWRAPQNVKPNPAKNQPGVVHLLVPGAVIKTAKPKLVVLSPGNEANVSA